MDSDEGGLVIDEDLSAGGQSPTIVVEPDTSDESSDPPSQNENQDTNAIRVAVTTDKSADKEKLKSDKSSKHSKHSSSHEHSSRKSSLHKSSSRHESHRESSKPDSSRRDSSHRDSPHNKHSSSKRSSSHKSRRDRSKERRSHSVKHDKQKVATPKKTGARPCHAFRLSHLPSYQSKILNISALKHQFYNMRLSVHRNKMIACELPDVYPPPLSFPDISLEQLFNWPNVGFTISLEHIQIAHDLRTNTEHHIVIGDDDRINIDVDKENVLEMRYRQSVPNTKHSVHKDMLTVYISSMMEAAKLHDVSRSKLSEILTSFAKVIDIASNVPHDLIETKSIHSNLLNKYKYMRVFDNSDESDTRKKVKLREVINPESTFHIERAAILTDQSDVWLGAIEAFFRDIFVRRNGPSVKNVQERLKKCLIMKCVLCNLTFDSAMSTVLITDHIKEKHFFDKPWECVKCRKSWSQFELTKMAWKHECDNHDTPTSTTSDHEN